MNLVENRWDIAIRFAGQAIAALTSGLFGLGFDAVRNMVIRQSKPQVRRSQVVKAIMGEVI